jgi:tetrahydromethanopterin:alpha-L-glutamate ligase
LTFEQTMFPCAGGRTAIPPSGKDKGLVATIGVISAYPEEDWDARRIRDAAARRGEAVVLAPTDFAARIGGGETVITAGGRDAREFDLFLTPRALGDEGDPELQLELYRTLAEHGARVVNEVDALAVAIDKFKSSWRFAQAGLPTPPVVLVQRLEDARRALDELGEVVCKPLYGSLGVGVERLSRRDAPRLKALMARHRALYLQAFVSDAERDVRAFVVGDRVEAAIARRPRPGEFRGNLELGASAEPLDLDGAAAGVAVAATRAVGLDYSGVDLLLLRHGVQLLEVNGTPSFRGIHRIVGRDMAEAIVEHALEAT